MVFWSDIDTTQIEYLSLNKDRSRFRYCGGPLRFQIPRGACTWGPNTEFKSFQVVIQDEAFIQWYETLEKRLCSETPFNSNLKDGSLRLKYDDSTLFFRADGTLVTDGLERLRGAEISCLMEIPNVYHFNEKYGLTCRAIQVRLWTTAAESTTPPPSPPSVSILPRRLLLDD